MDACPNHADRAAKVRGMCNACYARWRYHNVPGEADRAKASRREWYRRQDKARLRNYERQRVRNQPGERKTSLARAKSLRQYGMTPAQWDEMFDSQGRRCACCGVDNSGDGRWHTDHDDSIGKHAVRGILCVRCNIGIGQFRDSPALLRAAALYLEKSNG